MEDILQFLANFKKKIFSSENIFKLFFPKRMVGVDFGTDSIKVVELSRWGYGKTLENYGEIKSSALFKEPFRSNGQGSYFLSTYFISRAVRAILEEAKIKTKAAVFSLPDFSTFCTVLELPPMLAKEIPEAVHYNASQFIPLSLGETTIDWKLIEGVPGDNKSRLKVFLVAIPNQLIQDYKTIAEMAGLELYAVEAEVLSLERVLIKERKKIVCIVDIGLQSTTISISRDKKMQRSYSVEFSASELTRALHIGESIPETQAEEIKQKHGLEVPSKDISKTFYLLVDPLIVEIKNILYEFSQQEGKGVDVIYLTGGNSTIPGLKDYISDSLKINVEIPNCFNGLLYPPILEETLQELSPRFAVAVGAALGGLET